MKINRSLFWRDIARSWPVWGGLCLAYILFFLNGGAGSSDNYFSMNVISIVAYAADFLLVLVVFGFTGNPRETYFFYTMPISRNGLFLTKTLSCAAATLIPALIASASCFLRAGGTPVTVAAMLVTAMHFTYLGMALLLITLTGHPAVYVSVMVLLQFAVNILPPSLNALFNMVLYGYISAGVNVNSGVTDFWGLLSPALYGAFDGFLIPGPAPVPLSYYISMTCALAGAGVLCGIAAYFLFKRRRAERAGNFTAFGFAAPLFKYAAALCTGVLLTTFLLRSQTYVNMYRKTTLWDVPLFILTAALSPALSFFIAEMFIQKRVQVFNRVKIWVEYAAAAAVMALLAAALAFDAFGYETYIPAPDSVKGVSVREVLEIAPEDIGKAAALHRFMVEHKDAARSPRGSLPTFPGYQVQGEEYAWENAYRRSRYARSLDFIYLLKNGGTVRRRYYPADALLADETLQAEFAGLYYDLYRSAVVNHCRQFFRRDYVYAEATVSHGGQRVTLGRDESEALFQAAVRDMQAGHFYVDENAPPSLDSTLMETLIEVTIFRGSEDPAEYPPAGPEQFFYRPGYLRAHLDTRAGHLLAFFEARGMAVS